MQQNIVSQSARPGGALIVEFECYERISALGQMPAELPARFQQPLNHRPEKRAFSSSGFNCRRIDEVILWAITSQIEEQLDNPAFRVDDAFGLQWQGGQGGTGREKQGLLNPARSANCLTR
jgi:hypothetical protein